MTKHAIACLLVTAAFAAGRFLIEPRLTNIPTVTGTYEAFSHLWVGGLYGAWWVSDRGESPAFFADRQAYLFWSATAISLLELGMFILQKRGWL